MRFDDRRAAGRQLAWRLEFLRGQDIVVAGLPRGGIPVAYEVARALDALWVTHAGVLRASSAVCGATAPAADPFRWTGEPW